MLAVLCSHNTGCGMTLKDIQGHKCMLFYLQQLESLSFIGKDKTELFINDPAKSGNEQQSQSEASIS